MLQKMSVDKNIKKKEGFQGQKGIIIPRKILNDLVEKNKIVNSLYITDIGFYPNARFHYRERSNGSEQNILICCVEGKGEITIQKEKYILNSGEFVVIPAKVEHKYASDENNPWSIYWVHFKGSVGHSIIDLINKKMLGHKGVLHNVENIVTLFEEIYSQLENGYSSDNLTYSNMCFWHFITSCIYKNQKDSSNIEQSKDSIDMAIEFLKVNSDKSLSLHDIANEVNLSTSHLSFLFRSKTGFSPIEFFNHLKMQKACQHLLFTENRIKEISFKLGINDQYYFSRLFKKVMGVSPEEYRKKRRL
jgi:AraC-like DNA-binding protein